MALLGVAIAPGLPHWLGGKAEITADATLYFTIFVAALPILTLNYICGGMLRSAGQMKIPSMLNVLMCVLDVVFNFFLIFPARQLDIAGMQFTVPGAGLGVLGAALGTVLAEVIVALLMFRYLCWRQEELNIARYARESFPPYKGSTEKGIANIAAHDTRTRHILRRTDYDYRNSSSAWGRSYSG